MERTPLIQLWLGSHGKYPVCLNLTANLYMDKEKTDQSGITHPMDTAKNTNACFGNEERRFR